MKWTLIEGYERRWMKKYYAYFDGERLYVSTRRRDLPAEPQLVEMVYPQETKIIAGCPKCRCPHAYHRRYSTFYLDAIEKAKDCEEYARLETAFGYAPSIAKAYVRGTLTMEKLKKYARSNPHGCLRAVHELEIELDPETKVYLLSRNL